MSRLSFLRRTIDYLFDQQDAYRRETQKPHGKSFQKGLKEAGHSAARGLGWGLAAYAFTRYVAGADEQTATQAALYTGAAVAMLSGFRTYSKYAGDSDGMQSLKNVLRPAGEYVKYCRDLRAMGY